MQILYTAEENADSQFLLDTKWDTSWWMIKNKATLSLRDSDLEKACYL